MIRVALDAMGGDSAPRNEIAGAVEALTDLPDGFLIQLLGRPNAIEEELALAAQADLLLCREDCAGLCPKCGADLNAGPCPCRTATAEPV